MKSQTSIFTILLACWMAIGSLCTPAQATDTSNDMQRISYFADGSYLVTTITVDTKSDILELRSTNTKSGTKHHDYYNSSHELMWTFRIHGTFSYDGRSVEATSADYSYDIYNSTWSFNGGSASYSGTTATANGSFSHFFMSVPVTLSLTCSPKGVLS